MTRPRWCGGCSPTTRRSTPGGAGGCSRPSDRVYVNARARSDLGWSPRYDFRSVLDALTAGQDPRSPLAQAIGAKGYHDRPTGVYTS